MSEPNITSELLEIMICIECAGKLEEVTEPEPALRCVECGLHYPVKDGIPWMLAEEAYHPEAE